MLIAFHVLKVVLNSSLLNTEVIFKNDFKFEKERNALMKCHRNYVHLGVLKIQKFGTWYTSNLQQFVELKHFLPQHTSK